MSSTRNTKRKRSRSGTPVTSSTRDRATPVAHARDSEANNNDPTSTAPTTGSGGTNESATTAVDGVRKEEKDSESQQSRHSTREGTKKKEAKVAEPINNSSTDRKSPEMGTNGIATATVAGDPNSNSEPTKLPIDASSTSTSSQDESSTKKQALHIANDNDDREKRIRDLIAHRSLLLDRVRACRVAAEKRIGVKEGGYNKTTNADDDSDEEEIAAFRALTKRANIAARKLREVDGVGEKRTSVSLRRGASVGKRMNAALSSLAPGSHITGTTGGGGNSAAAQTTNTPEGKSSSTKNQHSSESNSDPKGVSPATKFGGMKSSNHLSNESLSSTTINTPTTSTKSNTNSKANKTTTLFSQQSINHSDVLMRGRPSNNKNIKMMKTGTVQYPISSMQSLKKNSSLPTGVKSASTMAALGSRNSLSANQHPKVNFPEAIMLREKRDQIELKLRNLVERRQNDESLLPGSSKIMSSSNLEDESTRRKAMPSGVVISKQISTKKLLHPAINKSYNKNNINSNDGFEIPPPAPLPVRRRTHWDTVLQEMAWLASDFLEERKWKLSTSRLISSNIPSYGVSDRRKRSASVSDTVQRETTPDIGNNGADDSSNNDVPEDHKETAKTSKNQNINRKYSTPVTDDEDDAKCRSQILSCMISKLDSALKKGGLLKAYDKHHEVALLQFATSRSDIIRNTENYSGQLKVKKYNTGRDTDKDSEGDSSNDKEKKDKSNRNGSSFDSIDDYVKHFHSICKSKHKVAAKETAKALKSGKIKLNGKQKEMLEFVDKLWSSKPHSGVAVLGASLTGMTFGTSAIIWKQRTRGSQILICPSRSLIRWKYELNRFSSIRVLIFGSTGGISNPDIDNNVAEIQSMDVILCEYASVGRMKNILKKMGVCPFSVTVDLRHFVGFCKSLRERASADSIDAPSEILSNIWWGDIVALVRNRTTRCLFLEYDDSDPLSLSKFALSQKEKISILAKRAACMLGPEIFDSKSCSIEREVISWARTKGKNEIADKMERVQKVLHDSIYPMCFCLAKPIASNFDLKWELRPCKMTTEQRQEYEKCCHEVRGALSTTIGVSDSSGYHYSIPIVANALFRLRLRCFDSRNHAIQATTELQDEAPTLNQWKHVVDLSAKNKNSRFLTNSSQPDVEKACSILNSSSKLRELVSILTSEAGYDFDLDVSTKKILGVPTGTRKGKDMKRSTMKIIIFAALPHIQNIVSTLLDSLGIQNEILHKCKSFSNQLAEQMKEYEAIARAKSQCVLSRFCDDTNFRKTNIIIASPAAFSGQNDGIGIEGSDMIIALDTDWSMRDVFILDSLIKRWHTKNQLAGKEDKLMRLICADSIETKIFEDNDVGSRVLTWPLDIDGFYKLPILNDEASVLYRQMTHSSTSNCSFPAAGVLQNRGKLLQDVLGSSSRLPSLFGFGKHASFLPRSPNKVSTDKDVAAELQFLKYFLRNERNAAVENESTTIEMPVSTSEISSALTSRKDMPVIESRILLEKIINSSILTLKDNPASNVLDSNTLLLNDAQTYGESFNPKIDQNPSSLLFYKPYQEYTSDSERSSGFNVENKAKGRYNAYAKVFSSSWNGISVRDGNQGCEALVFFPPLFPLLEEMSKKARIQYHSSTEVPLENQGLVQPSGNSESNSALKRKDRGISSNPENITHDAKRPKIQSATEPNVNGHQDRVLTIGTDKIESLPAIRIKSPDKSTLGNGNTETDELHSERRNDREIPMVEEDFGLLGSGAFPTSIDAASFSAHDTKAKNMYASSLNKYDHGPNLIPCDAEETNNSVFNDADEAMQSILLFVKKRQRSTQAVYKHNQGLPGVVPLAIGNKANVDESNKKIKKRGAHGNSQLPPTAFTRLPSNLGTGQILQRTPHSTSRHAKGDFRHKLLASFSARQRATGLTIFDSVPYRVAAMRVEKRVMKRLEKVMWKSALTLDVGPGLPIQLMESLYSAKDGENDRQRVTSIVRRLKEDTSLESLVTTQLCDKKLDFEKSLLSPRCVDFGAFEVGYLATPSGMTSVPTKRLRVGVSLPMGVKVMQPTKDQEKHSSWNTRDDKILQDAAKRFGTNWLLVAGATSGFEHAVINANLQGIENVIPSVAKSARQCCDRWKLLAQSQPSLANVNHRLENIFCKTASLGCDLTKNNNVPTEKGKASIYSTDNINILCTSDTFSSIVEEKNSTADKGDVDEEDNVKNSDVVSAKESTIPSPRSTVDKKDDTITNEHKLSHDICESGNDPASAISDVIMANAVQNTKQKRRSFSAISHARSRRQIFPISIPGVDVGGNASHPVPSHPSHMQSVQISVAAQWASGRTEMWPLQILDLADKQRSGAARINNLQRGEIPAVHNSSRRHATGSSSYQHRTQPSQSSAVRAPVGYSPSLNNASRPVAPRSVNPSVTQHHQHLNPQVAAATAQAYIPPPTTNTGKPKKSDKQKPPSKTSPNKA